MEYEKSVLRNQKVTTILTTVNDNNVEENTPGVKDQFEKILGSEKKPRKLSLEKSLNLKKNKVKALGIRHNETKNEEKIHKVKNQFDMMQKSIHSPTKGKNSYRINFQDSTDTNILRSADKKKFRNREGSPEPNNLISTDRNHINREASMAQSNLISTDRNFINGEGNMAQSNLISTDRNHINSIDSVNLPSSNSSDYFPNNFSKNALIDNNIDDPEFDMDGYKRNYKNHLEIKENMKVENAYNFFESNCKIEGLETYLVTLEKKLELESNLRKGFENKLNYMESVFNDLPISNCTKISDKNFMFLYKIITKENPIIGKNCNDIRKIEW